MNEPKASQYFLKTVLLLNMIKRGSDDSGRIELHSYGIISALHFSEGNLDNS